MDNSQKQKINQFSAILITTALLIGIFAGGLLSYLIVTKQINDLQNQVSTLQEQLTNLPSVQNFTYVFGDNASLAELYVKIKDSVVTIRGLQTNLGELSPTTQVQGSGFIYNFTGQIVIITNYHVVQNAINITVTFINGNGYSASVIGSDPYTDLAVLSINAPQSEYKPLEIVDSSTLQVGDPVIAVGNPYGLSGSMTTGIVSALGRSITSEMIGKYPIANIIQITAPINPGNSGGPLLNYQGQVIGITTAIVAASQGIGFTIPSNTILREIGYLITEGSYDRHPWLGVSGIDMNYEIAKDMNANITYGWLIVQVVSGGPADQAGLQSDDIIIALNESPIVNGDDLATYLEEQTQPGQIISITIVRNNLTMMCTVELGTRPPP